MATLKFVAWLCLMVCSTHLGAQGTSEPFSSLPEPSLVNAFLLANASNWKNPVLGEQTPSRENGPAHLQLIKCVSLTPPGGLSYDFYQVQPPSHACERPPPRAFSTHHQENKVWGHPVTTSLVAFFGLTVFSTCLVSLGLYLLCSLSRLAIQEYPDEAGQPHVELQVVRTSEVEDPSEVSVDCLPGERTALKMRGERGLWGVLFDEQGSPTTLLKRILMVTFIPAILAGWVAPQASECFTLKNWVTLDGPVGLPDPSDGLNAFLVSANVSGKHNITLKVCQTKTLNFYVGQLYTSCAQLGDPYAGRLPKESEWERDIDSFFCSYVKLSCIETIFIMISLLIFVNLPKPRSSQNCPSSATVETDLERGAENSHN